MFPSPTLVALGIKDFFRERFPLHALLLPRM
jgi:hypothetical protein